MFDRKALPSWGLAIFILAALAQIWVFPDRPMWPNWVWFPFYVMGLASVWAYRDRSRPKGKVFDFNPKRGAFYGMLGLVLFPVMALVDAVFGADLSVASMALYTAVGCALVGIIGTFTDRGF